MAKMKDDEILQICLGELDSSAPTGDLSAQRKEAMDRYLGEDYGDEVDGRSKVKTREVLETVEGLMPSIMRVFADEENLIMFRAQGPEDEEQAEQESDVISHIFWNENRGFFNLYSFCKDALLSKAGVLKVWADKYDSEEREEYNGLDDIQLGQLLNEPDVEREVIEYELTDQGHNIVFKTNWQTVKICIEPFAPEEVGVSSDARSPYICDARFSYAKHRKTIGELVGEGYDLEFLKSLPEDDETGTQEVLARRNLSDEQTIGNTTSNIMMRVVWVTECYLKVDRDGDDIPELLKVTVASGSSYGASGKLMDIEEIDAVPLFASPSIITTHKFHGLSVADMVMDLQKIQTVLLRQVLDNTYLANQGQTAANKDYVHIEDLLTRRPGGVVRTRGEQPIGAVLAPMPSSQLPPQTFEVMERLDEKVKRRTGMGDEVAGLDVSALSNLNTGVAAMAFEMARSKIELLARIIAEVGLKPLFHHIHELMMKNGYKKKAMKIRGRWVDVNPSDWKTRTDSDVMVGIGKISRERRIMGFEAIAQKQDQLVAAGAMGSLVMPFHIYEANRQWAKAMGFEPSMFFQDPRQLPPPPPQAPSMQDELMKAQAQAMMLDGQSKMMRAENERQKLEQDAKRLEMDAQYKQAEQFMKAEVKRLEMEVVQHKSEVEAGGKMASMDAARKAQQAQHDMDLLVLRLEELNKSRDRDLEYFKVVATMQGKPESPDAMDEMNAEQAETEARAKEESDAQEVARQAIEAQKEMLSQHRDATMVNLFVKMQEVMQGMSNPKEIEYDDNGLMVKMGGKPVARDEQGRVVRIG
jgi:hypothetical protein